MGAGGVNDWHLGEVGGLIRACEVEPDVCGYLPAFAGVVWDVERGEQPRDRFQRVGVREHGKGGKGSSARGSMSVGIARRVGWVPGMLPRGTGVRGRIFNIVGVIAAGGP